MICVLVNDICLIIKSIATLSSLPTQLFKSVLHLSLLTSAFGGVLYHF